MSADAAVSSTILAPLQHAFLCSSAPCQLRLDTGDSRVRTEKESTVALLEKETVTLQEKEAVTLLAKEFFVFFFAN